MKKAMGVKQVNFWYWLAKKVLPKRLVYFCYMTVIGEATSGENSKNPVDSLHWTEFIELYEKKHGI